MSIPSGAAQSPILLSGTPDAITVYQQGARIRQVAEVPLEVIQIACVTSAHKTEEGDSGASSTLPSSLKGKVSSIEKEAEVQILLPLPRNADQESIQVEFNDALAEHAVLGGVSVRPIRMPMFPFCSSEKRAGTKPVDSAGGDEAESEEARVGDSTILTSDASRVALEKRMKEIQKESIRIKHEIDEAKSTLEFIEKMACSLLEERPGGAGFPSNPSAAGGRKLPPPPGGETIEGWYPRRAKSLWDTSFAMWEKKTWEVQLATLENARRESGATQYELTCRRETLIEELVEVQRALRRISGSPFPNEDDSTLPQGLYIVLTGIHWNEKKNEEGRWAPEDHERSFPRMEVMVSYMIEDASWEPVYEVHLHRPSTVDPSNRNPDSSCRGESGSEPSASYTVKIHYSAKVTLRSSGGNSGKNIQPYLCRGKEGTLSRMPVPRPVSSLPLPSTDSFYDFSSVQLTLCTTAPRRLNTEPTLTPWSCGLEPVVETPSVSRKGKSGSNAMKGSPESSASPSRALACPTGMPMLAMARSDAIMECAVSPAFQEATAGSVEGEGSKSEAQKHHSGVMQFTLPHPVSIHADGEARHFPLVELPPISAKVVHVTVPAVNPSAYLRVLCDNESDYLLLPGRAALFLDDDSFLCHSSLPRSAPGAALSIDFGVDRAVEVERQLVSSLTAAQKRRTALFSSDNTKNQTTRTFLYRTVVHNRKIGESATVMIQEKIPKSNEDALKVKLIEPEWWANAVSDSSSPVLTARQKADFETIGRVEIKVDVPPNSSREVLFGYVVSYPASEQVFGLQNRS